MKDGYNETLQHDVLFYRACVLKTKLLKVEGPVQKGIMLI